MRALAAVAGLVLLAGCQAPPAEMSEAEIAQYEAEVADAMAVVFEGWKEFDLEKAIAPFHPTATSWALPYAPKTYLEIREWTAGWFEDLESWDGTILNMNVRVLGKDAVAFQIAYECTITPKDGPVMHYPGNAVWTGIMERTESGWKTTFGGGSFGDYEVIEEGQPSP